MIYFNSMPTTPNEEQSLEILLHELLVREDEIKGKVRRAYEAADKESEQPLKQIEYARAVLAQIEAHPFVQGRQEINPDLYKWHLTLPYQWSSNPKAMTYTKSQYAQFIEALDGGNSKMDRIIEIYCEGAKKAVISHLLKGEYYHLGDWESDRGGCGDNPVVVSWSTFALPNFLHSPLLGKEIHFWHAIDNQNGHLNGRSYRFRVYHNENGFVPHFYCRESGRDGTFQKMDEVIKTDFELVMTR